MNKKQMPLADALKRVDSCLETGECLLARTCKDLWLQTGDRKCLMLARDTYLNA